MVRRSAAVASLVAALAGPSARAQERTATVVPERPARVFVMAGFDEDCRSITPVTITIAAQPTQGDVSLRAGQETTVRTSASGKCIGSRVSGTGIYYTARANAAGADTFAITAQLGDSAPVTRRFEVRIATD